MLTSFLVISFLAVLPSCQWLDNIYNNGHNAGFAEYADKIEKALKVIAKSDSSFPGSDWSVVKVAEGNHSYVVFKNAGGTIYAVDVDDFNSSLSWSGNFSGNSNMLYNLTEMGDGTYRCIPGTCFHYGAITPTSYFYGLVFEETQMNSKDLEKVGAIQEMYARNELSDSLAANFGLSEERASEVSKLVVAWNKLGQKRALTDSDAQVFTKKVLGVNIRDLDRAARASVEGRSAEFDKLLEVAAQTNDISPERMRTIVSSLFE